MATFNPTSGPAQAWVQNEEINQVVIPTPTTTGNISTTYTELPEGVVFNEQTMTIYGAPTIISSGTFSITVTDDVGPATYSFEWSVIPYDEPLQWADAEDLNVVIGQPVDYQLPEPTGGTPPFTYSIVSPEADGGVPFSYDCRLPQGVIFAGGLFSGTPTDTDDNKGTIWYNQVATVSRQTQNQGREGAGRLFPRWDIPSAPNNQFTVGGETYTITTLLSRTGGGRIPGIVTNADDYPVDGRYTGGLRFRFAGASDYWLDTNNRPYNNPFVRITSVSSPEHQAYFYFYESLRPRSLWPLFYRSGYPVVAPWLYNESVTGNQFRVEIGTAANYSLIIQATDALGSSIRQTINVSVTEPANVLVPVFGPPTIQAHAIAVSLTAGVLFDGFLEISITRRGEPPRNWRRSEFRGTIERRELNVDTEYDLWARNVDNAGNVGRAALLQFRTLFSGEFVRAPVPQILETQPLDGKARIRSQIADITSRIISYEIQVVRATETLNDDDWVAYPYSTGATSAFLIPGLINGVEWRIGLRAVNGAGPGAHAEVRVTPQAGIIDTARESYTQLQVMMDLVPPGQLPTFNKWFDLSTRLKSADYDTSIAANTNVTKTGKARIRLETSDDFINIEDTAPYNLDSLKDREIDIAEVLEMPGGGKRRRIVFTGIVRRADFVQKNQYSYIDMLLVDKLGVLAQEEVVLTADLPAQLSGARITDLLDLAGWTNTDSTKLRYYNPDFIDEGSKILAVLPATSENPVTLNLLDEINLTARSENGRIFMSAGSDVVGPQLRFVSASPITQVDGMFMDRTSPNPAVIEFNGQPKVESEDSVLYNDLYLKYPGGVWQETDLDSVEDWGKRTLDIDVRTTLESTKALARALIKQYRIPRKWISSLPVLSHKQRPIAASLLQDIDLDKSFDIVYTPTGANRPVRSRQRIGGYKVMYERGDRQYIAKKMDIKLLVPESDVYWILEELGADALDRNETYLAPRRNLDPPALSASGRIPGGFRVSEDKEFQVMSAERFNTLSLQTMETYGSGAERNGIEVDPVHGWKSEIIFTDSNDVKHYYIEEYDGTANQWLRRAGLTTPDANPVFNTLLLGDATRGILGTTNVLASGTAVKDLRS